MEDKPIDVGKPIDSVKQAVEQYTKWIEQNSRPGSARATPLASRSATLRGPPRYTTGVAAQPSSSRLIYASLSSGGTKWQPNQYATLGRQPSHERWAALSTPSPALLHAKLSQLEDKGDASAQPPPQSATQAETPSATQAASGAPNEQNVQDKPATHSLIDVALSALEAVNVAQSAVLAMSPILVEDMSPKIDTSLSTVETTELCSPSVLPALATVINTPTVATMSSALASPIMPPSHSSSHRPSLANTSLSSHGKQKGSGSSHRVNALKSSTPSLTSLPTTANSTVVQPRSHHRQLSDDSLRRPSVTLIVPSGPSPAAAEGVDKKAPLSEEWVVLDPDTLIEETNETTAVREGARDAEEDAFATLGRQGAPRLSVTSLDSFLSAGLAADIAKLDIPSSRNSHISTAPPPHSARVDRISLDDEESPMADKMILDLPPADREMFPTLDSSRQSTVLKDDHTLFVGELELLRAAEVKLAEVDEKEEEEEEHMTVQEERRASTVLVASETAATTMTSSSTSTRSRNSKRSNSRRKAKRQQKQQQQQQQAQEVAKEEVTLKESAQAVEETASPDMSNDIDPFLKQLIEDEMAAYAKKQTLQSASTAELPSAVDTKAEESKPIAPKSALPAHLSTANAKSASVEDLESTEWLVQLRNKLLTVQSQIIEDEEIHNMAPSSAQYGLPTNSSLLDLTATVIQPAAYRATTFGGRPETTFTRSESSVGREETMSMFVSSSQPAIGKEAKHASVLPQNAHYIQPANWRGVGDAAKTASFIDKRQIADQLLQPVATSKRYIEVDLAIDDQPFSALKLDMRHRWQFGRSNLGGHEHFITLDSQVVSKRHCELWEENGKIMVQDMGSSGGTFINQKKLSNASQTSKKWPVKISDEIRLGSDFFAENATTLTRPALTQHRAVTIRINAVREVTAPVASPLPPALDLDGKTLPAIPKKGKDAPLTSQPVNLMAGGKAATQLVKYHIMMNSTFAKVKRLYAQNVEGETIMEVNLKAWETTGIIDIETTTAKKMKDFCRSTQIVKDDQFNDHPTYTMVLDRRPTYRLQFISNIKVNITHLRDSSAPLVSVVGEFAKQRYLFIEKSGAAAGQTANEQAERRGQKYLGEALGKRTTKRTVTEQRNEVQLILPEDVKIHSAQLLLSLSIFLRLRKR